MQRIQITRPDDWHIHLRDGDVLKDSVRDASRYFGRAIIMPNLQPPVATAEQALAYRERILSALPEGRSFQPLMTLYLTDKTHPQDIRQAKASGQVYAAKLYPAGATTNSASGVTALENIFPVLETMQKEGLPLLVHGEVTDSEIDIFERERVFIDRHLRRILESFPGLKVVMEHITTQDAAEFVAEGPDQLAATITPQHLLYNRNHLLVGGIRPHLYCLPILKRNRHQQALQQAVASGSPKFFLGTDSAPHARGNKETACGCAGCYSAFAAIELYAEIFDSLGILERLEGFASHYGADFYGLPRNTDRITLEKRSWTAPETLPFGSQTVVPLRAGEPVLWQVV